MYFIAMRKTEEDTWVFVTAQERPSLEEFKGTLEHAALSPVPLNENYLGELAIYRVADGDPPELALCEGNE